MEIKEDFEKEPKRIDKESLLRLSVVFVVAVIAGTILVYVLQKEPEAEVAEPVDFKEIKRQQIVKQLEELEKSKEEIPPLSNEEIQNQLKELNSK